MKLQEKGAFPLTHNLRIKDLIGFLEVQLSKGAHIIKIDNRDKYNFIRTYRELSEEEIIRNDLELLRKKIREKRLELEEVKSNQ